MTVSGNGGDLTTYKQAHVRNYGDVWLDEQAITNILLCLKNVKKQFSVTYDSEGSGVFTVHKPKGKNVLFKMHANGLHYHHTGNRKLSIINTVSDNQEAFSKRKIDQAKRARDFQSSVGHPSTVDLKNIVKANLIANCPVAPADIDRAEKIFGPRVPILKGKTTCTTPDAIASHIVAVPPSILKANQNISLHIASSLSTRFHSFTPSLNTSGSQRLPSSKIGRLTPASRAWTKLSLCTRDGVSE
jgi:hypothetical protein